jgi:hypothetical protein
MAAYSWLGGLREPTRKRVFAILEQAFATDDGRAILATALDGQLRPPEAAAEIPLDVVGAVPYPGLGTAVEAPPRTAPPIFITARFRSGSTLLWNLFRQVDGCTAYYEPLNERRWFDPQSRGSRIDQTHIGVSDYWREYEGLERLTAVFRDQWIDRNLYMDRTSDDPNLRTYVQALIDAAPHQAVLQFNRVDFRLDWLRRNFPGSRLLHLYRHPRDQWCSSLVDITKYPATATMEMFDEHDHFYLLAWARDLRYLFPFLDRARATHAYQLFYLIWKLSYAFGRHYADASFCFEQLVAERETELRRLMQAAAVTAFDADKLQSIIVGQKPKWQRYADDEWFSAHESHCERELQSFFAARAT